MKRKRIILVVIILVAIAMGYFSYYLSYVSWLAGFIAAKYGGGKQEGRLGRIKSIVIPCRSYKLHLHHWVLAFITSTVCALKGIYFIAPELFYGFLGGLIFQGIYCYSDWYRVLLPRAAVDSEN